MGASFQNSLILSFEAVAAIHRAVTARLKRNLAGLATPGAYCVEHLAGTTVAAARVGVTLACDTAGLAALRFVCEAFLSIKLLLTSSKSEFLSAILADHGLVVVHEIPL